ncbi:hypothetical protein BDU57DRAFT_453212 [Ampelomyces quisqualis]|uniref:Probable double zinc ribbon domain-containing protein n=1 Tax=Ampelomyces quisqualis TaxID=50730 RepID=A0A6A5QJT0_AMPQU|nr:hypothetical protein BDU57DRAFT_453212 [Ampelomyces quisqualis]
MTSERAQEESADYGLSPAAREAKRLGLDLDFPPTPGEDDDVSPGARRLDLEPDSTNVNLTPAELEALERGLNLDFSPSHAMQLVSPADDRVVREYTTIGPEYHAARANKPIFDGRSISKGKSKATTSLTPSAPTAHLTPIGSWRCCQCAESHALHAHPFGAHITSVFTCTCPHRGCEDCILTGSIKAYKPLEEPILVQVSSAGQVLFGIVCSACGVAWRAQTVKPSVYTKLAGKSSTLNLRALANDMVREHGKQAGSAMVGFTGGACECGCVLSEGCLIFQILDVGGMVGGVGGGGATLEREEVVADMREKSFGATLEDRAKGIGKSTLTIEVKGKRVRHANPLMSNPV